MASIMSYLSLQHNFSNFSSRISPALAVFTSQLSLKNSPKKIPMEVSSKELRFSGWNQLLRRRSYIETPVVRLLAYTKQAYRWHGWGSRLALLHHARVWFGGRSRLLLGGARWFTATPPLQNEGWKGVVMWSSVAWWCRAWMPSSLKVAAAADSGDQEIDEGLKIVETPKNFGGIFVTGLFFFTCFVSTVHLLVGVTYCLTNWLIGLHKGTPINVDLLGVLAPVAACQALGHVMANVSFVVGATTLFTHIIRVLESFFSAPVSQFVLGYHILFSLWLSVAPIVIGILMASWTRFSFDWLGFTRVLFSNIFVTYRNICSKKAMTCMDNTNVYAYISIITLLFSLPTTILIDRPKLMQIVQYGFWDVINKFGTVRFMFDLLWAGILYHLYNQFGFNTLERVAPLTNAVENILKFVFMIGLYIIVFGMSISIHNGIGIAMAIAGVAIYSLVKANLEDEKRVLFQKSTLQRHPKGCMFTAN